MTAQVHVVQGQISQNVRNASVLRNGAVVSARVLSSNGGGSYTVSLAGQMIDVKSNSTLVAGQVFQAKVKIAGNQVLLSLVQDSKMESGEIVQKFGGSSASLSPEIQSFLSSLGFEPNAESFKILQFMQQIGMKIDAEGAKKALAKAKHDENKSEEKSQLSLLFEHKGILVDEGKVNAVFDRNSENKNESRQQHKNHDEKEFLQNVKKYFDSVDSAADSHEAGILTAFNTILSSGKKSPPLRHWLVFPFEWNFSNYSGNIRLLFDSDLKKLEKTIVNLKNPEKKHIFVLYYKEGALDSVRFSSDSVRSKNESAYMEGLLSSMLPEGVKVEFAEFNSLKGFCSENEKISMLDGIA